MIPANHNVQNLSLVTFFVITIPNVKPNGWIWLGSRVAIRTHRYQVIISVYCSTVEPLYNTIVFHQNTHKRHPIARTLASVHIWCRRWCHDTEALSELIRLCDGKLPVTGFTAGLNSCWTNSEVAGDLARDQAHEMFCPFLNLMFIYRKNI